MLENEDTKQAFRELLDALRKVDDKIRVRSNWQNLEKYMRLENEIAKWKNKMTTTETELYSEENRLNHEAEVHETRNFDADEEILDRGSREAIKRHFKAIQSLA